MSIVEYVPGTSIFHRMNAVTKLFFAVCFFIIVLSFYKMTSLLILMVVLIALWRISKLPFKFLKLLLLLVGATGAVFLLLFGFLYDNYVIGYTPIITLPLPPISMGYARTIGGILYPAKNLWTLTVEGILFGLTMYIKMIAFIFVFPMVIITTSITDFIAGLTKLKVPYKFSFTLAIALRIVPQINSSLEIIQDAQRVRGIDIDKANFFGKIKSYISSVVPMVLSLLRSSDVMDIALESRGFGHTHKPTSIDDTTFKRIDYITFAVVILLLAWSIYSAFFSPYKQIIPLDVGALLGLPPGWRVAI